MAKAALPAWSTIANEVVLWHATTEAKAKDIEANGIDLSKSRTDLDFGKGFYTTTKWKQAEDWAGTKRGLLTSDEKKKQRPAVIEYHVPLGALARLESLMFVRGASDYDAFWSFVAYCRGGASGHRNPNRAAPNDWYDVVCGPLCRSFPPNGFLIWTDSDQFSFHTKPAVTILDAAFVKVIYL